MKRILALICVLACLCGFALPALAAPDVITVTAQVPEDWTTVHLYAWVDDSNNLGAWPGTPMNKADDGRYTLEIPSGYTFLIINNGEGGAQTQDMSMDGVSDAFVYIAGTEGYVEYVDLGKIKDVIVPTPEPGALTDMALVGEGHDALKWEPDNGDCAMTKTENGVFTKELTMYKDTTIKFKLCGNKSWDGGYNLGGESDGIAVTAGAAVTLANSNESKDLTYTATQDCTLTVTVNLNGDAPTVTLTETAAELAPPPEKVMVKLYASVAGDFTPNVWAWGDNGNAFSSWPGQPMTKEGDWWVIEIPDDCHSAIINDGSSQTADLSISMGSENWVVVAEDWTASVSAEQPDGSGSSNTAPTDPADPTDPTDPTQPGDPDKNDGPNVILIVAIILGVVIVGAVVVTVILTKKKD